MRSNLALKPTSVTDLAYQQNCFELAESISDKLEIIRNTKQGLKFFHHYPNVRRNILTLNNDDYLEVVQVDSLELYDKNPTKFFSKCKPLSKRYTHSIGSIAHKDPNGKTFMVIIFTEFGQGVLCTFVSAFNQLDSLL